MAEIVSAAVLPLVIGALGLLMWKGKGFESFISGAGKGVKTAVGLLPTMVCLMVGLNMLEASGAPELLTALLSPIMGKIGIPAEIVPLLITHPISGSASTATFAELLEQCGADSFPALCASVIMGSSDTLIYVICVYFSGASGVKSTRHAYPTAVAVSLFCIFLSCLICRLFFP
jgi:spore maturation protein B